MKSISLLHLLLLTVFLFGCAPSTSVIQTAMAETQASLPTSTPKPTATSIPAFAPTPEPLKTDLLFQDPFTWPSEVRSQFPSLFSGTRVPTSKDIDIFNNYVEQLWFDLLGVDSESAKSIDVATLLTLAKEYCHDNGKFEVVIPVSWRDTLINRPTNYLVYFHNTGEYVPGFIANFPPPKGYEVADNPLDWGRYFAVAGFVGRETIHTGGGYDMPARDWYQLYWYRMPYMLVPSFSQTEVKFFRINSEKLDGNLILLLFIPGTPSGLAQEAVIEVGPDQYIFRRIQYEPQPHSVLAICEQVFGSAQWTWFWIDCPSGYELQTTRFRQWNATGNPDQSYILASRENMLVLMKTYPNHLQVSLFLRGQVIMDLGAVLRYRFIEAGVLSIDAFYVPNLPNELKEKIIEIPPTATP